ncbi:MAG: hypothetical protein IPM48_12515 [Saprospiraceae bacterium]|nr:hypothetical protein [Saprospiraceae bacterium]
MNHDLNLLVTEIEKTRIEFEKSNIESLNLEEELISRQQKYDQLKFMADHNSEVKIDIEREIFELEKVIAIEENQIENLDSDTQRCNAELNIKQSEYDDNIRENEHIQQEYQKLSLKINEIHALESQRKKELQDRHSLLEQQTLQSNTLTRKRDAKKNEFDLLKSMVEKMEGFPESSIFLSQNWKKDTPILLDLIYTDEKYRPAIEFYLEPFLNYLVVNSEEEAIQAIKILYGNAKGKANFFILNKISENTMPVNSNLPNCKAAIDLIETDSKYSALFKNLLHNVFIIDKEGSVDEISKYPDDQIVITLSGSIIKNHSTITGGSVGLFEGKKLGRKKNLEKLEVEINELDQLVLKMDKQLSDLKNEIKRIELSNHETELSQLLKEESSFLQSLAQIDARLKGIQEIRTQLYDRIKSNESQKANYLESKSNQLNLLLDLRKRHEDINHKILSSDQLFGQISAELSISNTNYNQSRLEAIKWENKHDNLIKEQEYKNKLVQDYETQLQLTKTKLDSYQTEILHLNQSIQNSNQKLQERYELKKFLEADLSQLEQEYFEIRNQISIKENQIKETNRSVSEMQSSINQIKDQRTNLNFRIQSTIERSELEFNLKIEDYISEEETDQMTEEQLRDRVQYYKVRLENYGEINPLALEAYDEMKSRYDNITLQRSDILTAQESLLQTIKEIEQTATESFLAAFNQVRLHFQNVFRSLFTSDDDCDLVLMDEMDPLECDIDIIAKPKGKRPKSIHQLSGGEKTLTAIALLFSLYLLKPAPFCIFDEVDAPLDDINIDKFNHIIRKFSKDSQFVIITHNKLTMAEVDVLYGVYMEEPGISNVTAVDFRTYSHDVTLAEMEA